MSNSNSNKFDGDFIVASSPREAIEKLEAVIAKLKVEEQVQLERKAAKASKQVELDFAAATEAKPVDASSEPLKIEDAPLGFNPEDVIAQLQAATKKERQATTDRNADKCADTGAREGHLCENCGEVHDSDSDGDESKLSDAVRPLVRRMYTYFRSEMEGARDAIEAGQIDKMVGHVIVADVLRQAASHVFEAGEEMLGDASKQIEQHGGIGKLFRKLRRDYNEGRDKSKEN